MKLEAKLLGLSLVCDGIEGDSWNMSKHDDLATAIEKGDAATVKRLLQMDPELVNSPEWTPPPLHCAILWNQPKIAEILLDNGADIEIRDPDRNTTPLRYAIVFCKEDLVKLFVAQGANAGEINGSTAMELAVEGANGGYEEFEDCPSREEYGKVIEVLRELGVE